MLKFRKTKVEVSHAATLAAWSIARSTIINRPGVFHPFCDRVWVSLSPVFALLMWQGPFIIVDPNSLADSWS